MYTNLALRPASKISLCFILLNNFMEEEKVFYKTDFISNAKEEKDKLEQKSRFRGNKTNI